VNARADAQWIVGRDHGVCGDAQQCGLMLLASEAIMQEYRSTGHPSLNGV